jgi:hypothetical protein
MTFRGETGLLQQPHCPLLYVIRALVMRCRITRRISAPPVAFLPFGSTTTHCVVVPPLFFSAGLRAVTRRCTVPARRRLRNVRWVIALLP